MRQIDWSSALSEEDITWLRQTGIPAIEHRISDNARQHGGVVPDIEVPGDTGTQSALDPNARGRGEYVGSDSAPINVTPTDPKAGDEDDEDDDYDTWKVADLDDELKTRNQLENVTVVQAEGTGKDGKVLKPDLIKALRLWDQLNPDVLED